MLTSSLTVLSQKEAIIFGDAGWDSIRFHSYVAGIIIEEGYGYPTEMIAGSSPVILTGMRRGDVDVQMEVWTVNLAEIYNEALASGDVIELGINFDDSDQDAGLFVPTFLIEGDPERGIEPMAPNLKTVKDLAEYWELFKDPEDPSKGRIYGSPPGWNADEIFRVKIGTYGLYEYYNYFSPGSDTALATAIVSAYERGEPIVAYYWEPTWVMGMLDLTLLQEDPYNEELWNDGYACAFETMDVTVAANADLPKKAPEVTDFLRKYRTSGKITSEALAYMRENETDEKEAAIWFLNNREDVWLNWVPADIAQKVRDSL